MTTGTRRAPKCRCVDGTGVRAAERHRIHITRGTLSERALSCILCGKRWGDCSLYTNIDSWNGSRGDRSYVAAQCCASASMGTYAWAMLDS